MIIIEAKDLATQLSSMKGIIGERYRDGGYVVPLSFWDRKMLDGRIKAKFVGTFVRTVFEVYFKKERIPMGLDDIRPREPMRPTAEYTYHSDVSLSSDDAGQDHRLRFYAAKASCGSIGTTLW